MKGDNFGLSPVKAINELFPLDCEQENMPATWYLDDLKESIISLSEMMLTMDKEEREEISSIIVSIAGTHKMLFDMYNAVLRWAVKQDSEEK